MTASKNFDHEMNSILSVEDLNIDNRIKAAARSGWKLLYKLSESCNYECFDIQIFEIKAIRIDAPC